MSRVPTILLFILVVVVVFVSFAPVGAALGEMAHTVFGDLTSAGTEPGSAALGLLLGVNVAGLLIAFVACLFGGVRVPSGIPQVFFALLLPLTTAALQARFFELAGSVGGLADVYGGWAFAGMFVASVAVSQVGVHVSRALFERRRAGVATSR